jgi:hypothetical protein
MRSSVAIAIALFVLVSAVSLPFIAGQTAAGAAADITVSGRIVTGFGHDGLEGVRVSVDGGSCITDANGDFEIVISRDIGDTFNIRFEKRGYLVKTFFYNGAHLGWNDVYTIDVDSTSVVLPNVIMDEAFGTVEGMVMLNGRALAGVTVEIYDIDSGERTMKTTNDEGLYTFSLPVGGDYRISVSNPYYEADSRDVHDLTIEPYVWDFELTPKSVATYLFGLDFTHSLMVIGGIVGLFLLIFVISYRIHIGKHPEASKIHSDPKKKDQEE